MTGNRYRPDQNLIIMEKTKANKGRLNSSSTQKGNKHPERQENMNDGDNSAAAIKDSSNKGKGPSGENL